MIHNYFTVSIVNMEYNYLKTLPKDILFKMICDIETNIRKEVSEEISELRFISLQKLKEMSKNEQEKKRFVSFVYFDDIVERLENFINPKNK